jgi:hypothetical protein
VPSVFPPDNIRIRDNPKVLFPHALSPAIPIDSPSSNVKSTSSTAYTGPLDEEYRDESPLISRNTIIFLDPI